MHVSTINTMAMFNTIIRTNYHRKMMRDTMNRYITPITHNLYPSAAPPD
jgi:hypothetical protein